MCRPTSPCSFESNASGTVARTSNPRLRHSCHCADVRLDHRVELHRAVALRASPRDDVEAELSADSTALRVGVHHEAGGRHVGAASQDDWGPPLPNPRSDPHRRRQRPGSVPRPSTTRERRPVRDLPDRRSSRPPPRWQKRSGRSRANRRRGPHGCSRRHSVL